MRILIALLVTMLAIKICLGGGGDLNILQDKIDRCNDKNGTITYIYDNKGNVIDILCTDSKNREIH